MIVVKLFILAALLIATLLSPRAGPVDAVATLPITWSAPAALNTNATTDTGSDGLFPGPPQVTIDGAGNWVAIWSSNENLGGTIGTDNDILVARSTDNGAAWSAPAALNTNATTDAGADNFPQVTTNGAGKWVAVWTSAENLGGTIGTDSDILVARSTIVTPVGGIAELPEAAGTPLEAAGSPGSRADVLAGAIAGAVLVGVVAFGGAAWYTRRRWMG